MAAARHGRTAQRVGWTAVQDGEGSQNTRVGALIRRTSLDELPQLFNVIRGEMSLVGPRPLPTEESDRIDGAALARLDVNPGITGLWQICGRSDLTYADLQHLDSAYVRSWSLRWDLRIMAKTPSVVFG